MKTKPILYSAPMVRAILEGRKTQTRRVLKPQPPVSACYPGPITNSEPLAYGFYLRRDELIDGQTVDAGNLQRILCPYGKPGDLLWAREEHYRFGHWEPVTGVLTKKGRQKWAFIPDSDEVLFDAPAEFRGARHHNDPYTPAWHKRLARFMFREHSRFTQRITGIRVERLQDISEADAIAEGVEYYFAGLFKDYLQPGEIGINCPIASYRSLWESINGPGSWDANPWVWVIETEAHLCNVDEFLQRAGA